MSALRIAIIGISGCGKSTLAQQLSEQCGLRYFKIDELYWQENWALRKSEEFYKLVEAAIAMDRWVIDERGLCQNDDLANSLPHHLAELSLCSCF